MKIFAHISATKHNTQRRIYLISAFHSYDSWNIPLIRNLTTKETRHSSFCITCRNVHLQGNSYLPLNVYVVREICTQMRTNCTHRLRNQQQIRGSLDCSHVCCWKGLRDTTKTKWVNYLHN